MFREEDMLCLLKDTSDISISGIQYCLDSAIEMYGESSKVDIARDWINNK